MPLRGWGLQLLLGTEVVLEPDVGLQFDVIFESGGPEVWSVLLSKFPEPLHLQGASSNFPGLRVKAHKTSKVSLAFWAPASSGEEGLPRWLLSYYKPFPFLSGPL